MNAEPRRIRAAPAQYHVEIVQSLAEVHALSGAWQDLQRRCVDHEALFFQSHAWIAHLASLRSREGTSTYRQFIATVWSGTELRCIWPLALFRRQGAWIAASLDDPYGQFGGALFAGPEDAAHCIAAIVETLRNSADGLQIEAVPQNSLLHAGLLACGAVVAASAQAVVVDLRKHATARDFAQTVNAKTRKNMRNLTNRLKRGYAVEHLATFDATTSQPVVAATFDARVAWLHKNGRTSAAFRDTSFRKIISGITAADGLEILGLSLQTADATIASQWGFVYEGRYYAYMSAMNDAFAEFSPGRLHLGMVIEFCFEHGIKVLELMPPPADYKLAWTEEVRNLDSLSLPFTLKGRLADSLTNVALPAARKLSRSLPEGLRKWLVRRVNRE